MSSTNLPSSFDGDTEFYEENRWQKLTRRLKEEPLVPLGCALTCWALYHASKSIRSGDQQRTNRMFRARIYAQGFTIVAMVAGSMYWKSDRQKRKEFDDVVAERKAKEKNELWIKELEARDEEEKEIRAEKERRSKRLSDRLGSGGANTVVDEKEQKQKSTLESVKEMIMGKK
ncbi:Respiratory supercomplex factor 1, mitochondrial [Pseudogymnoascus australis]